MTAHESRAEHTSSRESHTTPVLDQFVMLECKWISQYTLSSPCQLKPASSISLLAKTSLQNVQPDAGRLYCPTV
jgi:hypothetical protein